MERRNDRLVIWLPSLFIAAIISLGWIDGAYRFFVPGAWFPLIVLVLILALHLTGRRRGVRATSIDRWLALAVLAPALLVAVFADRFLFLANVAAATVGLGILASVYGGKLRSGEIARDPLGLGIAGWRAAVQQLAMRDVVRPRAAERLLTGGIVALVAVAVVFWTFASLATPTHDTLAQWLVVFLVFVFVSRVARGWILVGLARAPSEAVPAAGSAPTGPGRRASAWGSHLRAASIVLGAVVLGALMIYLSLDFGTRHLSPASTTTPELTWIIGARQILTGICTLMVLAAIGLAGALVATSPPRRTAAAMAGALLAATLLLVSLSLVVVTAVVVLTDIPDPTSTDLQIAPLIAALRMAVVLAAATTALVWRLLTLRVAPARFGAGAAIIAGTFVLAVNLLHPDALVPGLLDATSVTRCSLCAYPPDDAVPWIASLVAPRDGRGSAVAPRLRRDALSGLYLRRSEWGELSPRRTWLALNLSARRAKRIATAAVATVVCPSGIAVAPDNTIYVADTFNDRVVRFSPDGSVIDILGGSGRARGGFDEPADVAVASDGTVYVVDSDTHGDNDLIRRFDACGAALDPWPVGDLSPGLRTVGAAPDGSVWLADWRVDRLVQLAGDGSLIRTVGADPAPFGETTAYLGISVVPDSRGQYDIVLCDLGQAHEPAPIVGLEKEGQRRDPPVSDLAKCFGGARWESAVLLARQVVFGLSAEGRTAWRFPRDGRDAGDLAAGVEAFRSGDQGSVAADRASTAIVSFWDCTATDDYWVDDIAVSPDGTIYVSDRGQFVVWRARLATGIFEPWLSIGAVPRGDPPAGPCRR